MNRTFLSILCSGISLLILPSLTCAQPELRERIEDFSGERIQRGSILPSSISPLFPPLPASKNGEEIEGSDLAARIDSFCIRHPELRSLILKELLVGKDERDLAGMTGSRDRFALQWGRIPRMTEFQRNSLMLRRSKELMDNPSLTTIVVPQADLIGLLRWLIEQLK